MFGETPLYENASVASSVTKYSESHSDELPQSLIAQREWTINNFDGDPDMMISPLQAQFHIWIARALGVRRVLEIGCFTGYSALGWAHALRDVKSPKVVTLEFNPKAAEAARAAFKRHNVEHFVEVLEGDAQETIKSLAASDNLEPFDLVFIDADKESYPAYLDLLLQHSQPAGAAGQQRLLHPGAFLLADNILRRGLVANDSKENPYHDKSARNDPTQLAALRKYNDDVKSSPRLEKYLLPLFDGINMAKLLD